jgi:hypothetical protein
VITVLLNPEPSVTPAEPCVQALCGEREFVVSLFGDQQQQQQQQDEQYPSQQQQQIHQPSGMVCD